MSQEFEREQTLRDLYYNPVTGYSSAQRLYEQARQGGLDISLSQTKKWLAQQETYVRFQQPQKSFKRAQTYVPRMADQLQIDLVDMSKYENENKGYRWILTGIDVFSRYFFAIPVRRKHKDFVIDAVKLLLEQFEEHFEKLPNVIQFDEGGEFKNTQVLPFLEEKGIRYFSTRLTSKKAAVVERANRTLKTRMWRFFDHQRRKEWIYVLESLVQGINQSVNSSIGMEPTNVSESNEPVVSIIWTPSQDEATHLQGR